MATVPTLVVGGTDQTAFIQDKTLGFRLKSLDFTLVDPATDPVLHDVVTLDTPEWHGRVSTIESHPWRANSGDDHRWVKVTATNKHVPDTDTAPFGISDTPNHSTTFPYKDLGVIRTLADQTDLATSELRMTGIVYEPGLLPGMLVEVTSDAEGLVAHPVYVVELSVNWLRDDAPEYHFELSDTNTPLPGLGDLINDASCDCVPFVPCTVDYTVQSFANEDNLACIFPAHSNGQQCESTDYMILYEGARYRFDYLVHHIPGLYTGSNGLSATIADRGGGPIGTAGPPYIPGFGTSGPMVYFGDAGRSCAADAIPDDIPAASTEWTVTGYSGVGWVEATAILNEASCFSGDSYAASVSVTATWLSGPDPRFEDVETCSDDLPHSGQRISPESFTGDGTNDTTTLVYPYMRGTLEVYVEGVDWTSLVTESDPDAGEFSVAYPYPLASDPFPNVYVHYRYP